MSSDRRHTDVIELGWADFMTACARDPLVRVEGQDTARTHECGRLVRFNRVVHILVDTARESSVGPRVHALRTRRDGERLVATTTRIEVRWEELDWVSWDPLRDPAFRRAKVTVTGQSNFGTLRVYEDGRLVDTVQRRVEHYGSYDRAVSAAIRLTLLRA